VNPGAHPTSQAREAAFGWSAIAASASAVFAWAACCVLPIALSLAGINLAGTAVIAGQRTWVTLGAAIMLAAGWWRVWGHRRACTAGAPCAPPSRRSIWLLSVATALTVLALVWQPVIEPAALALLRAAGG